MKVFRIKKTYYFWSIYGGKPLSFVIRNAKLDFDKIRVKKMYKGSEIEEKLYSS